MMKPLTILGQPVAKPRMTQRDKWMKRTCVMRYRAWADAARKEAVAKGRGIDVAGPMAVVIIAYFGFPPSYSAKKCVQLKGKPHTMSPDSDNISKAVLDSIWPKGDSAVYDLHIMKQWDDGRGPRVEVRTREASG